MPQLDKIIFIHTIFWFLSFFLLTYFFIYIYAAINILVVSKIPLQFFNVTLIKLTNKVY